MKVGREVERRQSLDGKHLVRIFTRGESCFYFVELSEMTEEGETFWATTRTSEERPSLEAARNNAFQELPWLKNAV
jgi:hypothetical protein